MTLAEVIAHLQKDRRLQAFGYLDHGLNYYVAVLYEGSQLVFKSHAAVLVTQTMHIPFDMWGVDDSTRQLIARVAKDVDWTVFRDGIPLVERRSSPAT